MLLLHQSLRLGVLRTAVGVSPSQATVFEERSSGLLDVVFADDFE